MKRMAAVLPRLLPRITANAACQPHFYEYRCRTSGCTKSYERRTCQICNGVKSCSSWGYIGCCGGTCC